MNPEQTKAEARETDLAKASWPARYFSLKKDKEEIYTENIGGEGPVGADGRRPPQAGETGDAQSGVGSHHRAAIRIQAPRHPGRTPVDPLRNSEGL